MGVFNPSYNIVQQEICTKENIHNFHILLAVREYFLADLLVFTWKHKNLSFVNIANKLAVPKPWMFSFAQISRYTVTPVAGTQHIQTSKTKQFEKSGHVMDYGNPYHVDKYHIVGYFRGT